MTASMRNLLWIAALIGFWSVALDWRDASEKLRPERERLEQLKSREQSAMTSVNWQRVAEEALMAQIAWQVFCNIAVVTNTLPNTGISLPFFSSGGTSLILLLAEMGVMVNIGRNGERARLEREEAHAERERQRKAKTIVLDTARRAQTEQ